MATTRSGLLAQLFVTSASLTSVYVCPAGKQATVRAEVANLTSAAAGGTPATYKFHLYTYKAADIPGSVGAARGALCLGFPLATETSFESRVITLDAGDAIYFGCEAGGANHFTVQVYGFEAAA